MADILYSSAGVKLAVCATAPATFNQAGYEALAWVDVGGLVSLPDLGDTDSEVSGIFLGLKRTKYRNGSASGASGDVVCSYQVTDAGQVILAAAKSANCDIYARVTLSDTPCAAGTVEPTVLYMPIIVTKDVVTGLSSPDNQLARSFGIRVNDDTVKVDASITPPPGD